MACMFVVTVLFVANADPYGDSFALNISNLPSAVTEYFLIFMAPVLLVTFLSISVSNLSLLRHEGRSAENLIGVFLGLFLIVCSVLVLMGWDVIYGTIIFDLYCKGYQWVTVLDTAIPMFFASLVCYLECLLFGVSVCALNCAKHRPKPDKDFIVILGCAISKDGKPLPLLRGRVDKAIRFAEYQQKETGKQAIFVPSGGQGDDECVSEACAMKNYLLSCGIPENRIFMEDKSVNTLENMTFSKKLIDAVDPSAKVVFSTTNYHVFRSGIYARQIGFDAEGIGSSTKWYFWPNAFVREFIALLRARMKSHLIVTALLLAESIATGLLVYFTVH